MPAVLEDFLRADQNRHTVSRDRRATLRRTSMRGHIGANRSAGECALTAPGSGATWRGRAAGHCDLNKYGGFVSMPVLSPGSPLLLEGSPTTRTTPNRRMEVGPVIINPDGSGTVGLGSPSTTPTWDTRQAADRVHRRYPALCGRPRALNNCGVKAPLGGPSDAHLGQAALSSGRRGRADLPHRAAKQRWMTGSRPFVCLFRAVQVVQATQ